MYIYTLTGDHCCTKHPRDRAAEFILWKEVLLRSSCGKKTGCHHAVGETCCALPGAALVGSDPDA